MQGGKSSPLHAIGISSFLLSVELREEDVDDIFQFSFYLESSHDYAIFLLLHSVCMQFSFFGIVTVEDVHVDVEVLRDVYFFEFVLFLILSNC